MFLRAALFINLEHVYAFLRQLNDISKICEGQGNEVNYWGALLLKGFTANNFSSLK